MLVPYETVKNALKNLFENRYDKAIVYEDTDKETVIHEGPIKIRADGWIELPTGRLLSPESVHHIDIESKNNQNNG